jgi:peptide chain release factor 2
MLIDDLKELLRTLEPDITTIKAYWHNAHFDTKINDLEKISLEESFWQNPDQARILKELQALKTQLEQYEFITKGYQDFYDLIDLFAQDEQELQKIAADITTFKKSVASFKVNLLLNDSKDVANCFLSINAGAGGTESQDWANMLLRMFIRFCERNKFNVSVIDYQPGEEAGIKSATLYIKGKNAYGLLKSEHGIHRLVRISPFDSNKRRHTSFAGVMITPETPELEDVQINPNDLRIDTYRSSGAGGQHVNKTESAVRITHIPTNIVVQCQNERSQIQNRETAMAMLKAKLAQKAREEQESSLNAGVEKKKIEWGSQIRSYVLHPYKMIKDHRTDHESFQPDLVLDGDLMDFIETYLVWLSKK